MLNRRLRSLIIDYVIKQRGILPRDKTKQSWTQCNQVPFIIDVKRRETFSHYYWSTLTCVGRTLTRMHVWPSNHMTSLADDIIDYFLWIVVYQHLLEWLPLIVSIRELNHKDLFKNWYFFLNVQTIHLPLNDDNHHTT